MRERVFGINHTGCNAPLATLPQVCVGAGRYDDPDRLRVAPLRRNVQEGLVLY